MSNQNQKKKKNNQIVPGFKTNGNSKLFKAASGKQQVEDIFPVDIDPSQITPDIKQYIMAMEKEYLSLQTILLNNRIKYEEMFAGLATLMDQRGISSQELISFFGRSIYNPPEND